MPVAVVTGASKGLGRALARGLVDRGWSVVVDARDGRALEDAAGGLRPHLHPGAAVVAVAGDVADPGHRRVLVRAAAELGPLDLLVNNASTLGPTPLPDLAALPPHDVRHILETDVVAPLALIQEALPALRRAPAPSVLNVTSDAAVEAYRGWGGYGLAKAALDHLSAVLGVEEPDLAVWAVDPGDMRTAMHQAAFPGEDISDRPAPEEVVPALLALVEARPPSGRYRAAEIDLGAGAEPAATTEAGR
ncbi:MAG TPA: SDR family oxidoreductase [Acidimicrobiales bacterium]|nr:SDR family oxidoreductase [Acidimicrobiales bacterium]